MEYLEILRELQLPPMTQLGFVVRDITEALPRYAALYGIRTWYETDLAGTRYEYKGQPLLQNLRAVLGFWGSLQIELLASYDTTSNLYTDFLAEHGEGLQHVACDVADLEKRVAMARALGIEPLYRSWFSSPGGVSAICAYLDLRSHGGTLVELVEAHWHGWPVKNSSFSLGVGARLGQVKVITG